MSDINKVRRSARLQRKRRVRKKIAGTADRPRVSVFRSHSNIYAQVINDLEGRTLAMASSLKLAEHPAPEGLSGKCAVAYNVGRTLADLAKEQGLSRLVLDRSGYLYHGRVAALARGLRDGGIEL